MSLQELSDKATPSPWSFEAFAHRVDIDGPEGGWLFRYSENEACSASLPPSDAAKAAADAALAVALVNAWRAGEIVEATKGSDE